MMIATLIEKLQEDISWLGYNETEREIIKHIKHAITLLEEQEPVRCKDCKNWIHGHITDQDDFIPPKCGKYQQMVGHSSDDFCSLAEQ